MMKSLGEAEKPNFQMKIDQEKVDRLMVRRGERVMYTGRFSTDVNCFKFQRNNRQTELAQILLVG